jgi:hypothetical protein
MKILLMQWVAAFGVDPNNPVSIPMTIISVMALACLVYWLMKRDKTEETKPTPKLKEDNPSSQHSVTMDNKDKPRVTLDFELESQARVEEQLMQLKLMSRNLEKIADNTKGIRTDLTILILVFVVIPFMVEACKEL